MSNFLPKTKQKLWRKKIATAAVAVNDIPHKHLLNDLVPELIVKSISYHNTKLFRPRITIITVIVVTIICFWVWWRRKNGSQLPLRHISTLTLSPQSVYSFALHELLFDVERQQQNKFQLKMFLFTFCRQAYYKRLR